jgi:hypothetical protein
MIFPLRRGILVGVLCIACHGVADATLVVNPPMAIDSRVNVRVIRTADDAGGNGAPLFGSAIQQAEIFAAINLIWSQAGIDVEFDLLTGTYDDSFALSGTPGNNDPRPFGNLNDTVENAPFGITSPDPLTLSLFVVRVVPGFSQTSDDTSNGLAFVDGNGISLWAGPNLTSFAGGRDVIAAVLAHEIGHNLGLEHNTIDENLMRSGAGLDGERLNAAQIALSRSSQFVVPVPEPGAWVLLLVGLGVIVAIRRGRRAATA